MAHKSKRSRRKQRRNFFLVFKLFAAGLYWLLSFVLIAWELWDKFTG